MPLLQKAPSCRLVASSAAALSVAQTECSASSSAPISLIMEENEGQEELNHDPLKEKLAIYMTCALSQ